MSSNPPTTIPQPFYTSKAFWTGALAAIFNLLVLSHVVSPTTDTTTIVNGILAALAIVFRWSANQPLALPGAGVTKL